MDILDSIEKWEETLAYSYNRIIVVYKHSNSCAISSTAFDILESSIEEKKLKEIFMVVVQDNRDVSDRVSKDLVLKHETPQVILIKEGQVLYFANHYDINIDDVLEYLHNS